MKIIENLISISALDVSVANSSYFLKQALHILACCLASAKGKYIARMDADDYMHPDRLRIQYLFMEQNSDVDICSTWMKCFGEVHFLLNKYNRKIA